MRSSDPSTARFSNRLSRLLRAFAVLSPALVAAGCQLEKLAPETVANGVARLSVRNAGAMLSLLNADTRCGFGSEAVKASAVVEGQPGEEGRVTLTVTNCAPDVKEPVEVGRDCKGNTTVLVADGLVMSGTQVIEGTITGNPANPVVPNRPDAVTFQLSAEMDRVKVSASNNKAFLRAVKGKVSWTAKPMLAISNLTGVCSAPTPNVAFSNLVYEGAQLYVNSGDRAFDVDVPSSDLSAQAGRWADKENALEGHLTVWDDKVSFPSEDDRDGLDPDYRRDAYAESYECGEELRLPLQYACPALKDVVRTGAAQLSVSAFGRLVNHFDEDTRCGFQSPGVTSKVVTEGRVGEPGGTATYTIASPCVMDFAPETVTETNCSGLSILMTGRVSMTGTKKIHGILTGDSKEPIIPTSRDPAEVSASFTFDRYQLTDSNRKNQLTIKHGELTGKLLSRVAIDTRNGACSLKTPVATFVDLTHRNSSVTVESEGMVFDMELSTSKLNAQNGPKGEQVNTLSGTFTVDGQDLSLPLPNMSGELDPAYEAEKFLASYTTCREHLKVPRTERECSFKRVLAENAARLLVQSAAVAAMQVNNSKWCGFSNPWKMVNPDQVTGDAGEYGSIEWSVDTCGISEDELKLLSTDCSGERKYVVGDANVSAKRTITGMRKDAAVVLDSIEPAGHDAATLELTGVVFDNYSAYSVAGGASAPLGKLTLHSGWMTGTVLPRLGERENKRGVFDVPTPVATFEDILVSEVDATLETQGKRFRFHISGAKIHAQNGAFGGRSNYLSGSVTLGGELVKFENLPLNPDYQPERFNQSYLCTENLLGPVSPN